jgi:hypothetical protein
MPEANEVTRLHPSTVQKADELAREGRKARRNKRGQRVLRAIGGANYQVPEEVLKVARELAKGDLGRIELCKDGAAIVHNNRRDKGIDTYVSRS